MTEKTKRSLTGRYSLPIIIFLVGIVLGFLLCISNNAQAHNKQLSSDEISHKQQGQRHCHLTDDRTVSVRCEYRRLNGKDALVVYEDSDVSEEHQNIMNLIAEQKLKQRLNLCQTQIDDYDDCRTDRWCVWEKEAKKGRELIDCLID